jgi:hypothetical protein
MNKIVPASHPQATLEQIKALMDLHEINDPCCVVGWRGYYKDSMGHAGVNDVGIYDDALFIVSGSTFAAFNANTDPSRHRAGKGKGAGKGMANLKPGIYRAHQLGLHRGKYMALIQTGGPVTVVRDGNPPYDDRGFFGINIHKGGYNTTSSLGCQTIYPDQWPAFIALAQKVMHENHISKMPYLLVES